MKFGDIFRKSWKEYKNNFGSIFRLMLFFYAVPAIILFILTSWWFVHSGLAAQIVSSFSNINLIGGNISAVLSNSQNISASSLQQSLTNSFSAPAMIIYSLIALVFALVTYFSYAALSAASLRKERFSFADLVRNGREFYWKSICFWIVLLVFLGLLFVALIVPGIIFSIFWVFSYFVFLDEKKGIIFSLRRSYNIVRGRWWKTLGYLALLVLIIIGISVIFSIPSSILQMITLFSMYKSSLSVGMLLFSNAVKQIFNIAMNFVTLPLFILFVKNFYLSAKRR